MNDVSPFVRVVVPAFNKAELTAACFRSLLLTDWPKDRIDLVLIDNGSSDDTTARIKALSSEIHLVSSPKNLGFAGGCNLGISARADDDRRPLGDFDYLALINNDAEVDPAWLREMIAVVETRDDLGAVSAKILLTPKFSEVVVTPVVSDRTVYVEIRDVLVNGRHQDHRLRVDEVFVRDPERNASGQHSYWLAKAGALRIVDDGSDADIVVGLELSATSDVEVGLRSGSRETSVHVPGRMDSVRIEVPVARESFDVVNSVGGEMYRNGFGGDRGYLERDAGQFEESVDLFSWCGAAALIRRAFLDEVGTFDPHLFLYYEDFDLSWRGRLAGWSYAYAPKAVIRHHHAQTSVEGSDVFRFFTVRNRLLVLAKNAPAKMAVRALLGEIERFARSLGRVVIATNEKGRRQQRQESTFRAKVLGSYLRHLPWMLLRRWTMVRRVERQAPLSWSVDKKNDPGFIIDRSRIQAGSKRTRI